MEWGGTMNMKGMGMEWTMVHREETMRTEDHILVLRRKLAAFAACLLCQP